MKKYSVIVGCLICFLMRCHQGWKCSYNMRLTTSQQRACTTLYDVLQPSSNNNKHSGDDLEGSTSGLHWYDCAEAAVDDLEDSDDEVYEDDESSSGLDTEPGDSVWHQIAENQIQAGILDLLISLYTQLPTGHDDKFFSPILRFAVLSSLQKNGQWLPPRRITHILAVLLFCGRLVMMALMHRQILQDSTIRYSKCVMCVRHR
jgi:hypothetical protein